MKQEEEPSDFKSEKMCIPLPLLWTVLMPLKRERGIATTRTPTPGLHVFVIHLCIYSLAHLNVSLTPRVGALSGSSLCPLSEAHTRYLVPGR